MSIKVKKGTAIAAQAAAETAKGRNKDPNRAVLTAEDQLRALVDKAELAWVHTTYSSIKSLTAFNKAVENVTRQFELREHIRRRTTSAANLNIDSELRQRINAISAKGTTAGFLSSALRSAKIRSEIAEQATKEYARAQIKHQKERLKLEQQLIRQDQQNFKLGRSGRVQSMGLTSAPPLGTPPNYGVPALRGGGFILGGSRSNDPYTNGIDTLHRQSRANSTGFILRGGPYNPAAPYQHPGAGMGGHGGLPIPMGGYAQRRGVPIAAQYTNLPSAREYAGVPQRQTEGMAVGPYTGEHVFSRRFPRPFPSNEIKAAKFPLGKFIAEMLGGPGIAIETAIKLIQETFSIGQTLATQMRPTLGPYNELFKASQMTGGTVGGLQNLFSAGRGGLGVSDNLARWGYHSQEDAAAAYSAYGGSYRPMATFAAATQLGQGKNTMFMGNEDWAAELRKSTGLGMGLSGGGSVEQTKKIWTDTIAAGVAKGMPPEEMWKTMQKVLSSMLNTGMPYNYDTLKMMSEKALYGVGSTVPGLRTGSAQANAIQAWQNASENPMGGTGLYGTALLSEAKRLEGTTDLSSKQWQDLITKEGSSYKIDPESAAAIDALRATGKFKGAMGTMMVQKFLAHRNMPYSVMENMYFNSASGQLRTGDPRADRLIATAVGAAPGSEKWEMNTGALSTPGTSATTPFTVMSAHGRRTPFTAGGKRDVFDLGPPPAGVAPGTSAGEARIVDASATAAKLAVANFELDTLSGVTDRLNRSFTNLLTKIDKWVGGAPAGKATGPSA